MKWVCKNKVTLVLVAILLLVACYFISYTNVLRNKRVKLEYNGQPFIAYSFSESYTEGMRYIKIRGQVGDGEVKEYLFDLKEEKVLSLAENGHLHASFAEKRYSVSVFTDGRWEKLDNSTMVEQLIRTRDTHPQDSMIISFSDRLGKHKDFQIDFSVLPDYRTTDSIDIAFSTAGDLTKVYTTNSSYLLDMESQQFINPPDGFDEGKGFKLIADDSLALYAYRKVWNLKENTILYLDYDKKYDNYAKHFTQKGDYIYWGSKNIYACNTQTGETQLIFNGALVAQPDFDMNDIKFISDNEVGAIGAKLREWYELGLFPGANNYFIMKYNFDTQKMKSIKLPVFAGTTGNVFAWSYDKSEVYFVYTGKFDLYKMKI